MYWLLRVWLLCVLASVAVGQHRVDQDAVLSGQSRARMRAADMAKQDEPSCEQLKAMWRFSKRQVRAPELNNEVNSYRDPLMYNEWPAYRAIAQPTTRIRSARPNPNLETYGRVVTKAPPNVVRTPDFDEMYGMLNVPFNAGKILRYPGPSRNRGAIPVFAVPPTRHKFEDVRKMIQAEHIRELQRKYEAEQKHELKALVASGRSIDDYAYANPHGEHETRGYQPLNSEYPIEDAGRHPKKPLGGSRQVNQFSRYSDALVPSRRSGYPPLPYYADSQFAPHAF